jgi:hypothetical protein
MKAAMLSAQTKRPASHKWALFVFFWAAATNIMLNAHGRFDVLGVVVTLAALGALFASFFLPVLAIRIPSASSLLAWSFFAPSSLFGSTLKRAATDYFIFRRLRSSCSSLLFAQSPSFSFSCCALTHWAQ